MRKWNGVDLRHASSKVAEPIESQGTLQMPIQGVAFDAYGTLFDVYSIAERAEQLCPGYGQALANLWRDKQLDYSRLRTLSSRYTDFWQVTAEALDFAFEQLKIKLTSTMRDDLMGQYARLKPFPENREALRALRDLGLPLAILSNGSLGMLGTAIEAAGFSGLFDHILSAESTGKFKTAPETYQLAPDAFGAPARSILFVSSNGWDACGATWFGYTTFWVNRAGNPPERLGVTPNAEGRSLLDVVAFAAASR
jgi:2-haloacid dehalogenase